MRRPRAMEDLHNDPSFLAQAHQLIGAVVMAATMLAESSDPMAKRVGEMLGERVIWFYEKESK